MEMVDAAFAKEGRKRPKDYRVVIMPPFGSISQ
jgi:hypothetical protein